MKIHTTQDLGLKANKISTNNMSSAELRLTRMQEMRTLYDSKEHAMSLVSFSAAKKGNSKDIKKAVKNAKKIVGDIKKKAEPEVEKGDKFLKSSFFNALLKVADYETVVQAAIAAVICIFLRPLTILALPTKKSKQSEVKAQVVNSNSEKNTNLTEVEDSKNQVSFKGLKKQEKSANAKKSDKTNNIYAAAHSMASGLVGLVTVFILTTPFKRGADYVMNIKLIGLL